MRKFFLFIAVAPLLAGCGLDVLEGKESPAKLEHEPRQALIMPETPPVNLADAIAPTAAPVVKPEPVIDPEPAPAPEPDPIVEVVPPPEPEPIVVTPEPPPKPACYPVFRVMLCDENGNEVWL